MSVPAQRLPMVDMPDKRSRRFGSLEALGPAKAALPLSGVSVRARVADRIAEVTVEQRYSNPLTEAIEAVYIFPLAGGAAVRKFELQVGARVVRGRVDERGEARRQYAEALEQGKRAALLEQDRDDVFTMQVGNLPPGEEVTVRLVYSERLPFFEDGRTELRLPLVVAPRYVGGVELDREPTGGGVVHDSTTVPDASRITPPRLAPGFDPKVSLSLEVELFGGFDDLACSQHATRLAVGPEAAKVALARDGEPLDRDFVLRWKLAEAGKVRSTLLVHDGHALLSLVPPAREGFLGTPRDVAFVVDRSGSMQGPKMASAARACALLLRTLAPRDRFAIEAFDDVAEWMDGGFVAADEGGIERGEKYLRSIESRGGTELDAAMREALAAIARLEGAGRVLVVVLLTDGQVGDESSVLRRLQGELGSARVFTVGIDTAVNDGFLKRLAALGGGTSTFVEPGAQLEAALQAVGREIGTPVVTAIEVEGIDEASLAPAVVPDLFAGRASAVFFRADAGLRSVKVTGRYADGSSFSETVAAREAPLAALGHLWARTRVVDLEDRFRAQPSDELKREIVALAIQHTLLTRFTAFVAVDETGGVVNKDGARRKLVQPVEMPAQWAPQLASMPVMAAGAGGLPHRPVPTMAVAGKLQATMAAAKSTAAAAVGRFFSSGIASREPPPMAREEVATLAGPVDRASLEPAMEALFKAVAEARAELARGALPAPDALEKARAALLQALASSSIASALPLLQKFLRASAVELVAALSAGPGAPLAPLVALFARHAAALVAARDELRAALGDRGKPPPDSFWEATI